MTEPTEKRDLKKDGQTLKLYMYTVQSGQIKIDVPEDFKAILAHDESDALNRVLQDYRYLPKTTQFFVKKRAQVEVQKLLDVVNLPELTGGFKIVNVVPEVTKEKTIKDFVFGMMLVADKFVTDKCDQMSLKRIINKIKIDENQTGGI